MTDMKIFLAQFYSHQPTPDYDKIAESLRENGHIVLVGTPDEHGTVQWHDGAKVVAAQQSKTPPSSLAGIPVVGPLAGRWYRAQQVGQIRDFIRREKPDVVQVNAMGLYRWLPVLMPRESRFVFDVRQINEPVGGGALGNLKNSIKNGLRSFICRNLYDLSCFLHEAGARKVLGEGWQKWATVVPMGVDPQFLSVPVKSADLSMQHQVRFIYIGRLTTRRLLGRLIEAAALVKEQTEEFRLTMMGYDETRGAYQEQVEDRGVGDVVDINPPIPYETVPAEITNHDVALAYVPEVPADWKYHPTLKVIEYRAVGMPIIASDFEPNWSFVQSGVNGLLVENDPHDIAAAMLRFITDRQFLAACSQQAIRMREGTTWNEVAQMYLDRVYEPLTRSDSALQIQSLSS
ncbi:MAG: glycosyltransferase family 4 protein [Chloroflexota bacterium]